LLEIRAQRIIAGGLLDTRTAAMALKLVACGLAKVLAAMLIISSTVEASEMRLIAANALKEAVLELVASGHKVRTIWGGSEGITKRVTEGETVDVVLIAAANIDRLIADGKLVKGSRADVAKSGVGVAVRSGLPKPDISSSEAVKTAVLAAKSVAYSSGPSGFYLAALFQRMGITDQIKDKVKQPPSGVQVGELVARGEADLGFQQISELQHVKGIDYLGPLPAEIQEITVYSAGLHSASKVPETGQALMQFLAGPKAGAVIKKIGMDPA
jgi:molybdate transport system substrate-binding protein